MIGYTPEEKNKLAKKIIIIFGLIAGLGDTVYEGARGIYGIYLGMLGMSIATIGVILGIAEFLSYVSRIASGFLVDRFKTPWISVILGYGFLYSVFFMAFTDNLYFVTLFIIIERLGKGIRAPGKDLLVSHATKRSGTGLGFGFLEVIDQAGALIGPLIFSLSYFLKKRYTEAFLFMGIPVTLIIILLTVAYKKIKDPSILEDEISIENSKTNQEISSIFWFYMIFIFLTSMGFVSFPLYSYHMLKSSIFNEDLIPIFYSFIMLVDMIFALPVGKIYDKYKRNSLVIIPILVSPVAFMVFSESKIFIIIGIFICGIILAIQEVIFRAFIADEIGKANRGKAYGIYNVFYGLGILLGSSIIGFLYKNGAATIGFFCLTTQIAALLIFFKIRLINRD